MRTVATFSNPGEAHLLAAHLGGCGIEVVLRDENTVQTDLLLTNAVGGVKVDVAEADFAQAMEMVRSFAPAVTASSPRPEDRKHRVGRYLRILTVIFPTVFVLAEWLVGWIEPGMVAGCSFMIAAGIVAFLALFDL